MRRLDGICFNLLEGWAWQVGYCHINIILANSLKLETETPVAQGLGCVHNWMDVELEFNRGLGVGGNASVFCTYIYNYNIDSVFKNGFLPPLPGTR